MKNCPQCGQKRVGEEFKCPKCDVFYSQLDQLLYEEHLKQERVSLIGRWKFIASAENPKNAFKAELNNIWQATPLRTKITLWTIFAFIFALIFAI